MGEFSLPHILIVLVVVLLVFGAKRLPEIGASMGKGIREFKKSIGEISSTQDDDRPPASPDREEFRAPQTRGPKRLGQ